MRETARFARASRRRSRPTWPASTTRRAGSGPPNWSSCTGPPGAKKQAAWLALVEPADVVPEDGPLYATPKASYIYRALSLVPQSMRDYWALGFEHYLPSELVYEFDRSIRAISRPQTEILAARVSALHQCAY